MEMYVHVWEKCWSNTGAIRELYVVLRNGLHIEEGFLKFSKNKLYRPVQIIQQQYIFSRYHTENIWGGCGRLREVYGMPYIFCT